MDSEHLMKIVMEQASRKGFGTKKEDIIVSEKIALIHSEISEAYEAYLNNNLEGKHGFYEEIGDALQRTLHLAGIFKINILMEGPDESDSISRASPEGKIALLHKILSHAWENYRKNKIPLFQSDMVCLIKAFNQMSVDFDFSLDYVIKTKIENNMDRDWKDKGLNERFT